eukprot:CAMPEP_0206572656 /NCGR_PEP_ID=MMETSP0325_2-20121206/28389_1 /ASSEMBLY_ACC=CAM_ASM_000347 /TAXON_ID=2866 /ORGANISM="Crypthecodinium cohnii, Strain Seligo" /LENGTH=263 /DNA_ID=CAMNT_0054076929 /DNA_START=60 /DNA_END=848 /DNA_ORIENTATION=+
MSRSGPIIEELPDDYEEPTPAVKSGFFGRKEKNPAVKSGFFNSSKTAAEVEAQRSPEAQQASAADTPSREAPPNLVVGSNGESNDALETLERRLSAVTEAWTSLLQAAQAESSSSTDEQGTTASSTSLLEDVKAALTKDKASRWPSTQMKSAKEEAGRSISSIIGEMRAASNDARRAREGEERVAASELSRVTEDLLSRMTKVVEASQEADEMKKDPIQGPILGFHRMAVTAKLRILGEDKAGWMLIGGSFLLGAVLASFFLL